MLPSQATFSLRSRAFVCHDPPLTPSGTVDPGLGGALLGSLGLGAFGRPSAAEAAQPMPPTEQTYISSPPNHYGLFLNDGSTYVIADSDYVLLHEVINNSPSAANVWAFNPVAVKNTVVANSNVLDSHGNKSSNVYGTEISVSNNTSEPSVSLPGSSGNGYPQTNGQLVGLYLSYINMTGVASAAISIGGLGNPNARGQNGWLNGIWIDCITSTGTGIVLKDGASGAGMKIGLDLTPVSGGFGLAAILLGGAAPIAGKTSAGSVQNLLQLSALDEVIVGSGNLPLKLQSNRLSIVAPNSTTATAGALTPPTKVYGYLQVVLSGTTVKIPYYAA